MGLFDSIGSSILKNAMGGGGMDGSILSSVLGEVMGQGQQGGLSAIVGKLIQGGLGAQVRSWLGNGANMPISPDQLRSVLGSEQMQEIAAKFGIPADELSKMLSQFLPQAVDQASPNGELAKDV